MLPHVTEKGNIQIPWESKIDSILLPCYPKYRKLLFFLYRQSIERFYRSLAFLW